MDGYNADRIENEIGELVWQGSIDIQPDLNKDVVTSFPVDEALPERKPGIYVLTAVPPGTAPETWDLRATQWFLVSDTGITTYAGTDGLNVFVRSLGSAAPLGGWTCNCSPRTTKCSARQRRMQTAGQYFRQA